MLSVPRAKRLLALAAVGVLASFLRIQVIRPELNNPPVEADLVAPQAVKALFVTACYDCHSNQTRLRWFDRISPAIWLVASDVKNGREHLNFSDFGALPADKQKGVLYE